MPVRIPTAVLVLVVGAVVGAVALALSTGATSRPAGVERSSGDGAAVPGQDGALAVLHAWDRRRGSAWARGDAAALGHLYVPGSPARRADLALLRRYRERGLVVRGISMQVLRARVLVARPHVIVVEVTDRLATAAAATVDDPAATRPLPGGRVATHVLRFRRVGTEWLLAAVTTPP